jgi:uncharacterized membrane protein YkvA (DUF1232 family)
MSKAKGTSKSKDTTKSDPASAFRSKAFQNAMAWAAEFAKNPERLKGLFDEAIEKAKHIPKAPFKETWAYFQAMLRLMRAYYKGTYREIPWSTMVIIIAAVAYVVNPLDLIPDVLVGVGLLDDASIIAFALRSVKDSLDAFMQWEASQQV